MQAQVRSDGGSGPPLVYVPGIDGTGAFLLGAEARLAARFRVLTLRYAAGTPPAAGADGYAALAASVAAAFGARVAQPALLLAESFGVAVALQVALDCPERVAGLALVNGFAYHPWRARLALSRLVAALVPHPLFRSVRHLAGPAALLGPRRAPEVERAFQALGETRLDGDYRRRLAMIQRLDLRPRLGMLHRPVAIFASDEDRIVPSVHAAREMHALLPDVELEVLPGAGHLVLPLAEEPWLERMERLARRCTSPA